MFYMNNGTMKEVEHLSRDYNFVEEADTFECKWGAFGGEHVEHIFYLHLLFVHLFFVFHSFSHWYSHNRAESIHRRFVFAEL